MFNSDNSTKHRSWATVPTVLINITDQDISDSNKVTYTVWLNIPKQLITSSDRLVVMLSPPGVT
jgi:hypothetical protein